LLPPAPIDAQLKTDRSLLQRVVENILDNSLQYTPANGRVGVGTRVNGGIEITVSNSGPPIPPSERRRVFEKFARIEPGNGARGNAGLGLYFCKRAIDALGGDIEVIETPEWPTSFVVRLPLS
jgi:signal transduction histidine kinase